MFGGEVIQIQLGEPSNRLCTDLWKHEYSKDMSLFKKSDTPLLVALGTLEQNVQQINQTNPNYIPKISTWEGKSEIYHRPSSQLPCWMDSMPSSSNTWKEVFVPVAHGSPGIRDETFPFGYQELYNSVPKELVENKIRKLAEKCDSIQGFNFVSDSSTKFGALACKVMEDVRDDFPSQPIVFYDIASEEKKAVGKLNSLMFMSQSLNCVSMIVRGKELVQAPEYFSFVNQPLSSLRSEGYSLASLRSIMVPRKAMKVVNLEIGTDVSPSDFSSVSISKSERNYFKCSHSQ